MNTIDARFLLTAAAKLAATADIFDPVRPTMDDPAEPVAWVVQHRERIVQLLTELDTSTIPQTGNGAYLAPVVPRSSATMVACDLGDEDCEACQ